MEKEELDKMEKEELDKMEEALRNTTAGQFAELEKAFHQCAASLDDVCNATNNLRETFNSVPPYQYRRTTVCAIGIIKKVLILISLLLALITLCLI